MKYLVVILFTFCSFTILNAQNFILEYRQHNLLFSKAESQNAVLSNYGDLRDNSYNSFHFDFVLAYQKEQLLYSIRMGFDDFHSHSSSTHSEAFPTNTSDLMIKNKQSSYKIGLGIERLYKIEERLTFYLGLEMPFVVDLKNHENREESFYNNGLFDGQRRLSKEEYKTNAIGLHLTSRMYFEIFKNWSLGINLSNGISFQFAKGSTAETTSLIDENGILVEETKTTMENKGVLLQKESHFSLGIQYRFK